MIEHSLLGERIFSARKRNVSCCFKTINHVAIMGCFSRAQAAIVLLAALSLCGAVAQAADSYPSKPIRMVIPYAAGGGPDVVARIIADKVTPGWGQNVVFDNRGGGGVIGAAIVAKANRAARARRRGRGGERPGGAAAAG